MKKIKNPSARLLAVLGLTTKDLDWEQTCHTSTCSHASHDEGFHFVEVEESRLDGVEIQYYPGTANSHGSTVLLVEHLEG